MKYDDKKIRIVAIDTTGPYPEKDEIIGFSVLDGTNEIIYEQRFKPKNVVTWSYAPLAPEDVQDKPSLASEADRLKEALSDCELIVAHSLPYIQHFLDKEGIDIPSTDVFDTMVISGQLRPDNKFLGLAECFTEFELGKIDPMATAHDKALAVNKLYNHLLELE